VGVWSLEFRVWKVWKVLNFLNLYHHFSNFKLELTLTLAAAKGLPSSPLHLYTAKTFSLFHCSPSLLPYSLFLLPHSPKIFVSFVFFEVKNGIITRKIN
jgi:hypothetical protein